MRPRRPIDDVQRSRVIDPIEPVLRVASERVLGVTRWRTEAEWRWAVGRKPR